MTDSTATYANMLNYANLIGSTTKAPVLVTSYYDYWAGRMKDYLIGLDKDLWRSVSEGPHTDIAGRFVVPDGEEAVVLNAADLRKIENDERAMRELRSGLGPDVSHHIADAKSAKEMWDNLELRFGGDKILHTSKVQEILADFGNFKQEENESLEACYERLSNMIYTLDKYGETRSQQEINIKFLYSLRKEWRPIMLMVKSYENIEKYKLAALYNLLKSHEPDVVGRRSEMVSSGSLALMSKEEQDSSDEDVAAYVVDENGDTVALYAANSRRFKKPFFKNNSGKPFVKNFNKTNFNSKPKPEIFAPKEESSKLTTPKPSEKLTSESIKEKTEDKKITGDSGYDCNYCHGKNHFAKDCMLRKQNEKKPQVKDEAYYARKLEEARVKTKDLALMAGDDRQGSYQVWSSDSDDEEVRKPSHSAFIAYDADKCFLQDTSEENADMTSGLGFVTSEAHMKTTVGTPKTQSVSMLQIDDSSDDDEELCLMANEARLTIPEQVSHFLSSFKIPASQSAPIIHEITRDCSVMHKLLIDAKTREVLNEQELLSLRGRVESQKLALEKANLRICSEVTNPSYKHGLISIEKHLTADNLLKILPQEIPILNKAVPLFERKDEENIINKFDETSECDTDMEEIDCSSLLKTSSTSGSHTEDSKCCNSKLKLQITDENDSYDQFLTNNSKRLVNVACIYPKISYFKNTIFVKSGGLPLIDNELQKHLEKDNSTVTNEGFFSSSKMIENNVNEKMEVKINIRKQDLYGHNLYNRFCFEKEKIPKEMSHLLNLKNDDHIYTNQNYKQIQVVEKPIIPKMNIMELMETSECVPFSQNPENEASSSKVLVDKTSVQHKPQMLKRKQALQKPKPTVKKSKPTQKPTVAKLKAKENVNLVKRKIPFKNLKQKEVVASTSGTKTFNHETHELKKKNEKPSFTPTNPNFPNPKYQKPMKKTFSKGNNLIDTFHKWLDNNLDMFKDRNLSLNDFKMA
ncbi:hypothetical protein L1887_32257 [Cichorium endivia]|nr:hypothetical protein L1887_32257 [Cichorium endivia]